jgi:hypothetical protein
MLTSRRHNPRQNQNLTVNEFSIDIVKLMYVETKVTDLSFMQEEETFYSQENGCYQSVQNTNFVFSSAI